MSGILRASALALCALAAVAAQAPETACSPQAQGRHWPPSPAHGLLLVQTKPSSLSRTTPALAAPADGDVQAVLEGITNETLKQQLAKVIEALEAKADLCCSQPCSSTTTTTVFEPNLCAAFGDPHFITFDGAQTTFVGDSIIWLVKTNDIHIQALSVGSQGKLLGFAVGGPFMKGHTLIVYSSSAGSASGPLQVFFDATLILQEQTSDFQEAGILEAHRRADWDGTIFNDEVLNLRTNMKFAIGDFPDRFLTLPESGVYMLKLPNRVEVTISGVDCMSTVISMAAQAGGQSGYCGNFNGNPDDDAEPVVPSWDRPIGENLGRVPEGMVLFPKNVSVSLLGTESSEHSLTSVLEEKKLKVGACAPELLLQAEQACGNLSAAFHKFCIFDVCITGDVAAAGDIRAAEVMEERTNARGVPRFMGHGQCLDSQQRQYQSFASKLRTDAGCQQLLRALSLTPGVMGAQLQRGSSCQVLVAQGADPTGTTIPGGWGATRAPSEAEAQEIHISEMLPPSPPIPQKEGLIQPGGEGIVTDVTVDPAWNCWQLD